MNDKNASELQFTYKQSGLFRVIKVDGAWGGLTPRADIQMALYSERLAIPDSEVYEIVDGNLGERKNENRRTAGPIREVEAMLSLSLPVARALSRWLADKADELESALTDQIQAAVNVAQEESQNASPIS